ncbi:MAG: hypothetical protein K0R12_1140, partial [Gammaproteobacteria bacterium]|nr:hypothetical protein [Gammaproteobacteria bacterium]
MVLTSEKVNKKRRYSRSFILSVGLHGAVFALMIISFAPKFMSFSSDSSQNEAKPDLTPIINATAFNSAEIEAEAARIETKERQEEEARVAKQEKLEADLKSAIKDKSEQQAKLAALQKQQAKLTAEREKEAAQRRKEIAQQKEQAETLAKLKKQQAEQAK